MLGSMRSGLDVPSRSFAAQSHEASIGCKICRVSFWIPHDRLIGDDDCCSWLDLVYELLGKLSVETDSRSDVVRFNRSALDAVAIHVHRLLRNADKNHGGPWGEISGCHQYSPGLSAPVGLFVGVPFV